jgi:hypothetical protein
MNERIKNKRYWNVQVELYKDGTVKAAVVRNKKAGAMPCERWYDENPNRDTSRTWYEDEAGAGAAVFEILSASKALREALEK